MKNASSSASSFLKHIISVIRGKTNALKARLVVMSLLKNKKFSLGSISHKIQGLLKSGHEEEESNQSKAVVLHNNASAPSASSGQMSPVQDEDQYYCYNGDDKFPDLAHSPFEKEDELESGDPDESVVDLVRNTKEGGNEDFKLEDEINHVADLFILNFHKRMRLQKLESFKRYQEMLQRSV